MSLANVRKHWRFLLTVLGIFVAVAAAGPLLFYGLPLLLGSLVDQFGGGTVLILAAVFLVGVLGWLFFVLWVGDWADRRMTGSATAGRDTDVDG